MLSDLIENRKSVRKYLDKNIPDEDLNKILRAGYLAPSWMNSQPWKFILVKNPETKKLLSKLALNQPHVASANAVIVCVADKNCWSEEEFSKVLKQGGMQEGGIKNVLKMPMLYPKLLGDDRVLLRSVEQVTFAVSYMMLQAFELGIDSCIIGAISNEATVLEPEIIKEVNEKLNLKEGQVIITMITLGYGEKTPVNKIRKNYNEVVFFEKIN